MVMARQNSETTSRLPIPNANGLVIGTRKYPGQIIWMKFHGSNII